MHNLKKKNQRKQPLEVFCKKRCFTNFSGKHPQAWNFINKRLQHGQFPAKFAKLIRTPILKDICEQLLLKQNRNSEFDQEDCTFQKNQNEIFTGFPKNRNLVTQLAIQKCFQIAQILVLIKPKCLDQVFRRSRPWSSLNKVLLKTS